MLQQFTSAMERPSSTKSRVIRYMVFVVGCVAFAYVSDYNWPTGTGNLCLILFLSANVYIPAKLLRKHYQWDKVQHYFDWMAKAHCNLNTAAFVMSLVHCYTTVWANFWLWLSMVLMGVLTLNGFIMKLRYQPKLRKKLYILHTQQVVFICLIYAMLKGHYVIAWLPL